MIIILLRNLYCFKENLSFLQIKIEIMNIYNPIKYSVRLLQHKEFHDSNWTTINKSNEYITFLLNMNNYFANKSNHKSHFPLKLNDLCCIAENNAYYRCKIIGIIKAKTALLENKFNIKLIDTNKYLLCSSSELLHLPEEYIQFPAQVDRDFLLFSHITYWN